MDMKKLIFGIYPGGAVGGGNGIVRGDPDNPESIRHALDELYPGKGPFLVRAYLHYRGNGEFNNLAPLNYEQYVNQIRKMDLVLGYQSHDGNLDDWKDFICRMIRKYGPSLAKIQIGEEPNLNGVSYVDGDSPNVRSAVVVGVIAAKEEILNLGYDIQVGFNGVPTFNPDNDFWREIGRLAKGTKFHECLDYVGLDFFPDVFRPVPSEKLATAIKGVLQHYRHVSLNEANISPKIELHITENGWATSPDRSEEKQAEVIEINIRTIFSLREEFNITHYELFDLRDADSANPDFFHQFGIMKHDYTPKKAFNLFKSMIQQLGV
jgi:hypothetical protein